MLSDLLLANINLAPTDDNRRKIIMINLTLMIALIIYPSFFIINYINDKHLIAFIDLSFMAPALYALYTLRKKQDVKKASLYTTLLLFTTTLIVIITLSAEDYILLWSYTFPFVIMVLQGPKKGLYYSIAFFMAIFAITYNLIGVSITPLELTRFFVIAALIVILAYFYERSVKNTFNLLHNSIAEIEDLNNNLSKKIKDEIEKNKENQKIIEEQSRLAQMGEMISMIAHQWRQPLASISAISGTLSLDVEMDNYEKSFFSERLENIDELSHHLSGTIDDFRNFFQPNKESELVLINSPVTKALHIIEDSLKSDNINIIKNYNSTKEVKIYISEMMQVILNILKNAQDNFLQNSTENPEITIKTFDEEWRTVVEISDNGDGIQEDTIKKIFNPYFSTKTEKDGTGLGLYMSKTIVEKHHSGELYATNTAEGVCFTIAIHNIDFHKNQPQE